MGMLAGAVLLVAAVGCRESVTRFDIVNYRGVGDREHFHEVFPECYYSISAGGRVDLVARRHVEGNREIPSVTQVVHARTEYQAIPGRTHADASMINATVHYAILGDAGGACFEGGAFFTFEEDPEKGAMEGALEHSTLEPSRRVGDGGQVFDRAELTGVFQATRNRRRVVAILNELNRVFGPMPQYQPPARPRDPI